jgi:hypothetical protein
MDHEPSDRMSYRLESRFRCGNPLLPHIKFLHPLPNDMFKGTTLTSIQFFIFPFPLESGVHGRTTLIKSFDLGIAFRFRVIVGS